jgi:ABC-2 type transport system ATP-binding protein
MMNTAIETKDLVKRFGAVTAVNGLTLHVGRGEIYAFLGLNGAGKTTTIRLLLGMIRPTSGTAKILGMGSSRGHKSPWSRVGYLVESADAYPELTVRENLDLMRRLRPGTGPEAVDRAIQRLGLTAFAGRRAGTLSSGNAQRLGLAKALLHDPQILILDEPTKGLDPAGIVEMRHLFLDLARDQGVTIFMSSHYLDEVSRMARRIGIIHQGRLVQELDAAEMARRRRRQLVVGARDLHGAYDVLRGAGLPARLGENGTILVTGSAAVENPDTIAAQLVQAGRPPTKLFVEEEDLEAYFLRLVGIDGQVRKI